MENSAFSTIKSTIAERKTAANAIISEIRAALSESALKALDERVDKILTSVPLLFSMGNYIERKDRDAVYKWISALDMETVHRTERTKAGIIGEGKAGKWILLEEAYEKWSDSETSSSLWLEGGVGTGKTILVSTVIEACIGTYGKDVLGPVAFFYCSGDPGTAHKASSAEDILRNLLIQLASCFDEGFALLKQKWDIQQASARRQQQLPENEIMGLIQGIIELEKALETTIIIDGLDELPSKDIDHLLGCLHILSDAKGNLKVFLASRQTEQIQMFTKNGPIIKNRPSKTKEDLDLYIEATVDERLRWKQPSDPALCTDVKVAMKTTAEGA
jgi:hypothetical protein